MATIQYSTTPLLQLLKELDDKHVRLMLPAFQLPNRVSARLLLWVAEPGAFDGLKRPQF